MSPGEPHGVQQIQVEILHLDHGNPHDEYKVGDKRMENSSAEKGVRGIDGWQAVHGPAISALTAQKANYTWAASKEAGSVGQGR